MTLKLKDPSNGIFHIRFVLSNQLFRGLVTWYPQFASNSLSNLSMFSLFSTDSIKIHIYCAYCSCNFSNHLQLGVRGPCVIFDGELQLCLSFIAQSQQLRKILTLRNSYNGTWTLPCIVKYSAELRLRESFTGKSHINTAVRSTCK
jgi:hypothetical protein